jgi:hypothetical protein
MIRTLAKYRCDGCKVVESDEVESLTEFTENRLPRLWLRVVTSTTDRYDATTKHYCPRCAPLVESYLAGSENRQPEPEEPRQ